MDALKRNDKYIFTFKFKEKNNTSLVFMLGTGLSEGTL